MAFTYLSLFSSICRRNLCAEICHSNSIFKRGNRIDYSNPKKQREYFDLFWKQVELRNFDDWYYVRYKDLEKFIGEISLSSIVKRYYNGSLSEAIKILYPEHEWDESRFRPRVSKGFWLDKENQKTFLEELALKLGVKATTDWYSVTLEDFTRHNGRGLLEQYGGSIKATLSFHFPELNYNKNAWKWTKSAFSKSQSRLFECIKNTFPNTAEIFSNYVLERKRGHYKLEVDICIPSLKVAFEYQGKQHYVSDWGVLWETEEKRKERDSEKKRACEAIGITLFEIPYWWDRTQGSLHATIYQKRPDIVSPPSGFWKPIPSSPLKKVVKKET